MAFQFSLPQQPPLLPLAQERRFLVLHLPLWATDYLKRAEPGLSGPLALYEHIKGGLRVSAVDREAAREGIKIGQSLADARALLPSLTVREMDRARLEAGFADFADWHSNASPIVAVMTDIARFGDLVLDSTGVDHLFDGERKMLRSLLIRLRRLNYTVCGAIAPTIGAAWAVSHFARSQVVESDDLVPVLDELPVAGLRLTPAQIAALAQMGLETIGQLRERSRKPLQARFGLSLLTRLDQAYGQVLERMSPRLPITEHYVERRFAEPISLLDTVLATAAELATGLSARLQEEGLGAQAFHLFLYRVDHKVMSLSVNSARVTRDASHIAKLFHHRAERLSGEYDAGFGIDMIRLAASSLDRLDANQISALDGEDGAEDLAQLSDRLASRLGPVSVLRTQLVSSHIPERAARLVPVLAGEGQGASVVQPRLTRPLRLLPVPEIVAINAEVPDGLPASMIWRRAQYRLLKGAGPERIGAEWWRSGQRLQLVPEEEKRKLEPGETAKAPPFVADLPVFDPDSGTRDYYIVEDEEGRRFWVFRQGFYGGPVHPTWYLHGFFA